MKAGKLLHTRASVDHLRAPAPEGEVLEDVLRSALRAPDHGGLEPFRIFVFEGDGIDRLGAILDPESPEKRARKLHDRAPMVIAVAATIRESKKVPELEQILSAGC